jgi:hypothetical protein
LRFTFSSSWVWHSLLIDRYYSDPLHLWVITMLSSFVSLWEGYIGIDPRLGPFQFYYGIKQQLETKTRCHTCGSMSFKSETTRSICQSLNMTPWRVGGAHTSITKEKAAAGKACGLPHLQDALAPQHSTWTPTNNLMSLEEIHLIARQIKKVIERVSLATTNKSICSIDRKRAKNYIITASLWSLSEKTAPIETRKHAKIIQTFIYRRW